MNAQNTTFTNQPTTTRRSFVPGAILVLIGLLALAQQLLPFDWAGLLFLPALGAIFLAWGLLARSEGLIIPGGILSGIGLGAILNQVLDLGGSETTSGGVFLLGFTVGWGLISLLVSLMQRRLYAWPLIPGGIMVLLGAALLGGETGLKALELAGKGWPVALIIVGLYLLLWRKDIQK